MAQTERVKIPERRISVRRRAETDMTHGSIYRHLVSFAIPLLLGNLFQQMYNLVDTWVVGNYVSNEAFSAVGSVAPITAMMVGLFQGFAGGSGVVISQLYGAHHPGKVKKAVHTAIAVTLILGVVFTAAGIAMIPMMLRFMRTPEEVIPYSQLYLTIYFAGIIALMLYNIGTSILQAVGNSRFPFICLAVCTVLNIILDLIFVVIFGYGIRGVALATVLSETISAMLILVKLYCTDSVVRLRFGAIKINRRHLNQILRVGMPTSLQLAITQFSNVFIQGYINYFGADCMSGWTAYTRIDQLILLPILSLGIAVSTFVGQNLGAGQSERARKGVSAAMLMGIVSTIVLSTLVCSLASSLVAIFNSKPEVIANGTQFILWLTPFYVFAVANHVIPGALRGSGNGNTPLVILLLSYVGCRQLFFYVMANYISNTMIAVSMGYPFGWICCSVLFLVYYWKKGFSEYNVAK